MNNVEEFYKKSEVVNAEEIIDDPQVDNCAEQECDIYEFLGVENEEDLEEEIEAIAGGRYDED